MRESDLHRAIMLALAPSTVLFRNNVGAYQKPDGSWLQYGVQNPGGSDLIGWTEVTITPAMVGRTVAVFTAVEVKLPGKVGRRTAPQKKFIGAIANAGGIAGFATSKEEAERMVLTFSQR